VLDDDDEYDGVLNDSFAATISHYAAPGGMGAGFEYYKALPQDAKEIKELGATSKLPMPVLALSGDISNFRWGPSWKQYI
jgi:hypothetical protein